MKKIESHKKFVDGLRPPATSARWNANMRAWIAAHAHRTPVLAAVALFLICANSVIYLAAFEAHVVNVTATIERPPTQCDALSIGYWRNHEGCAGGEGESDWVNEIHVITTEFSGIFYNIFGAEICAALWTPNCPSGNNILARRCRATGMTLADELNLVSGRLDLDALIAGADDGASAFDHLGLTYNSTVRQALVKIEMILGNNNSTSGQLGDAAYVAERIYSFYEDENPYAPQCVTDPQEAEQCSAEATFARGSGDGEDASDGNEDDDGNSRGGRNGEDDNNNENSRGNRNDEDNNNNENNEDDGRGRRGERGNREENGFSESSNNMGEHSATSTDDMAASAEESAESGESEILRGLMNSDESNAESGGWGFIGQDIVPAESAETAATSSDWADFSANVWHNKERPL